MNFKIFFSSSFLKEQRIKNTLDASKIYKSIFEDLYSNCLTGSLSILDSNHLLADFPIIGEETVQVCFRSMHTQIAIELRMRVTGISEVERLNENKIKVFLNY